MKNLTGIFGPIYWDFERKGQEAVDHLLKVKDGEVPNALFNHQLGWIDIVWGSIGKTRKGGFGLVKIKTFHPEALSELANIIKGLEVVKKSDNRYILADSRYKAVVSRVWVETEKLWLLTAFEIKKR